MEIPYMRIPFFRVTLLNMMKHYEWTLSHRYWWLKCYRSAFHTKVSENSSLNYSSYYRTVKILYITSFWSFSTHWVGLLPSVNTLDGLVTWWPVGNLTLTVKVRQCVPSSLNYFTGNQEKCIMLFIYQPELFYLSREDAYC